MKLQAAAPAWLEALPDPEATSSFTALQFREPFALPHRPRATPETMLGAKDGVQQNPYLSFTPPSTFPSSILDARQDMGLGWVPR